ncbi:MAG: hypothetical protein Q6367_015750, partial [Candidatus Freyarchaeota archaeon]
EKSSKTVVKVKYVQFQALVKGVLMFEFPEDFEELLEVFEKSNYDVYLIGARALILHGLLQRTTKDIGVMVSVGDVEQLRGKITQELRGRGFDVQWRSWGLSIKTPSSSRIDVNVPLIIYDNDFREHSKKFVVIFTSHP